MQFSVDSEHRPAQQSTDSFIPQVLEFAA